MWLDDVYLAMGENLSDPTLPTLTIIKSGDNVIVSWPAAATGYTLESTASLSPTSWATNTEPQVPAGDQLTVTLPVSGAPTYLRLVK